MISCKWASLKNMLLRSFIQHNASSDKQANTTPSVSFSDIRGIKTYSYLFPYQWAMRITANNETTHIDKKNMATLMFIFYTLYSVANGAVDGLLSMICSVEDDGRIGYLS